MINPLNIIKGMLLGGALCFAPVAAQDIAPASSDINYLKQSDARLTGGNASGLRYLSVDKLSVAEVTLQQSNGGHVNYCESDNVWSADVNTESFFRYNPKVVLYGKISYTHLQGKNWGGSAFYDPYYNPFDLVETADSTKGKKRQEIYHLIGALSFDATEKLSLGLKLDYKSLNYSKFKDLRHDNKMLDLTASAGLAYRFSSLLEVGANYDYRRTIEEVGFYREGLTDKTYSTLINYGGFWGKKEDFPTGTTSSDGYTRESGRLPMVNDIHGVSGQVNLTTSRLHFLNEFTYKTREGYYGVKSSSRVYYSEHNSDILAYKGSFVWMQGNNRHFLSAAISQEELENYETSYKRITTSTGAYYYEYYDPVQTTKRTDLHASVRYTYWHHIIGHTPAWAISGGYRMTDRDQTAIFYPYYRKQNITSNVVDLSAERNLFCGDNQYRITLGASYQFGSGNPTNDGLYATPSETAKKPAQQDDLALKEFEYLTGNHLRVNTGFRYARPFPSLKIQGYAAFGYAYTKAFDVEYLSDDYRHELSLKVGCAF